MGVIAGIVLAVFAVAVVGGAYQAGRVSGLSQGRQENLNRVGLTAACARRYVQAVHILERLRGERDRSGLLDGDTLSSQSHQMVATWLDAHHKEFPPS